MCQFPAQRNSDVGPNSSLRTNHRNKYILEGDSLNRDCGLLTRHKEAVDLAVKLIHRNKGISSLPNPWLSFSNLVIPHQSISHKDGDRWLSRQQEQYKVQPKGFRSRENWILIEVL